MKAVTLWQPYASAIGLGWKSIETRSWSTTWRGLIAIHAARSRTVSDGTIRIMASNLLDQAGLLGQVEIPLVFPRGAIVAVARLVGVVPTAAVGKISRLERAFGDYSVGRFAWRLDDVRAIEPIPVKGFQKLWDVPTAIARKLKAGAA